VNFQQIRPIGVSVLDTNCACPMSSQRRLTPLPLVASRQSALAALAYGPSQAEAAAMLGRRACTAVELGTEI